MAVSKRLRFEILRRDNHTCRYCGGKAPDVALTVDHVTPVALGGLDDPSNLVAACADCNGGKSSAQPDAEAVVQVAQDAVRWSRAMEQAADRLAQHAQSRAMYVAEFATIWSRNLHDNDARTLERFHDLGLPVGVMLEAADIAQTAWGVDDRWRYFAGICWKRIREMQEIASQLVAEDERQ